jgi:hypothetical protein
MKYGLCNPCIYVIFLERKPKEERNDFKWYYTTRSQLFFYFEKDLSFLLMWNFNLLFEKYIMVVLMLLFASCIFY